MFALVCAALGPEQVRKKIGVNATGGMYETSGDWLYEVGVPAPGKGGLGTFAPPLDRAGNSVRGQLAARLLSRRLGLSLFAVRPADRDGQAPRQSRSANR
ncbi:MAG: glutaminase [Trebonia sp.]